MWNCNLSLIRYADINICKTENCFAIDVMPVSRKSFLLSADTQDTHTHTRTFPGDGITFSNKAEQESTKNKKIFDLWISGTVKKWTFILYVIAVTILVLIH